MAELRLIDANALKVRMFRSNEFNRDTGSFDLPVVPWHDIEDADTIEAVPVVHGRWVEHPDDRCSLFNGWECSECKQIVSGGKGNYCPNCGATSTYEFPENAVARWNRRANDEGND